VADQPGPAPKCANYARCGHYRVWNGVQWEAGRDLCWACYSRSRRAGFPKTVPDPPAASSRAEEYRFLRDDKHLSQQAAALEMGVSLRTVERYERELRDR
jgi:hypothetical protein